MESIIVQDKVVGAAGHESLTPESAEILVRDSLVRAMDSYVEQCNEPSTLSIEDFREHVGVFAAQLLDADIALDVAQVAGDLPPAIADDPELLREYAKTWSLYMLELYQESLDTTDGRLSEATLVSVYHYAAGIASGRDQGAESRHADCTLEVGADAASTLTDCDSTDAPVCPAKLTALALAEGAIDPSADLHAARYGGELAARRIAELKLDIASAHGLISPGGAKELFDRLDRRSVAYHQQAA